MGINGKKVIISVTSDLVTDQRVHRSALTLTNMGCNVTLVGRKLPSSLPVENRVYKVKRFNLWWHKGPLFYAAFNFRLFWFLVFSKVDVFFANDLDSLAANYVASKLKRKQLIYDSHEYFTGVPELVSRPRIRAVWKFIEKNILPNLKWMITVNDSIAGLYRDEYAIDVHVIRNLPIRNHQKLVELNRADFNLPNDKTLFLFQGAGINVDRGAEEAVQALEFIPTAALLFIGGGDVYENIKSLVQNKNLADRVFFIPKQPFEKLISFTKLADFGLTLDKDSNINYRYSLPNKLFDYIQAGLPVLASSLPEVERIVVDYNIGEITPSHEPHILAEAMSKMINSPKLAAWKENLNLAAAELCWELEGEKLKALVQNELD